MATPQEYIDSIQAFLISNIGITSIRHPDGRQVQLDRAQAYIELAYWQNQLRLQSSNPYKISTRRLSLRGDA